MMERGQLPHLARLCGDGVSGNLETVNPPMTAPAWVSFLTGRNPGKHGLFGFKWPPQHPAFPDSESVQVVNSTCYRSHGTLLDILSDQGKKVGVINLPVTYPAWEINGFMVTGFLTPSNVSFTYPPELGEELTRAIPGYRIDLDFGGGLTGKVHSPVRGDGKEQELPTPVADKIRNITPAQRRLAEELEKVNEIRMRAISHLMEKYPDLDCLFLYFRELDELQHFLWHRRDAVESFYKMIDQRVGEILTQAEHFGRVVVMSDHGFRGATTREFHLNDFLNGCGLLVPRWSPWWYGTVRQLLKSVSYRLRQMVKRLPWDRRQKLKERTLGRAPKRLRRWTARMAFNIEWSKTRAYALKVDRVLGVNVNLRGREPYGIVEKEEYEDVRSQVKNKLLAIRDPKTGERVIDRVQDREEVYSGPYVDRLPDLIVVSSPKYEDRLQLSGSVIRDAPPPSEYTGTHSKAFEGIFIASGDGIKSGEGIDGARLLDVTPTLLWMLGCPIDPDMDGHILDAVFETSFRSDEKPVYKTSVAGAGEQPEELTAEQEQAVVERLRRLGYW